MEEVRKKSCFITPIAPDNSEIRRAAEGLIDSLILTRIGRRRVCCCCCPQNAQRRINYKTNTK